MSSKSTLTPNQRRKYPVGTDPRREQRREEAEARAEARASRTVEEQLALIETRPGKSTRERTRLEAK